MGLTDTTRSVRRPRARRHELFSTLQPSDDALEQAEPVELHELMSPEVNVQRIMATGSRWFVGAIVGVALALGLLLASGWRPAMLPPGLQGMWWVAFLVVTLAIGLIGWSGCPILEVSVPVADRNKTRTMQLGTALFIVGSAAALAAVLLGPVQ
jgi:Kef-type K+ transport system membrane component KefB